MPDVRTTTVPTFCARVSRCASLRSSVRDVVPIPA
jgi:hypothetical protein